VDARNPLLFRTEDLEKYVLEVDAEKRNLLLVNKADLMTLEQRREWAEWFDGQGIRFAFYSARLAKEAQETGLESEDEEQEEEEEQRLDIVGERVEELGEEIDDLSIDEGSDTSEESSTPQRQGATELDESNSDPRTRILTVFELQSLFLRESPPPKGHSLINMSLTL
jgi:large subunit GTPase 1